MFTINNYPCETAVASYIGKSVANNLHYKHITGVTLPEMQELQMLKMTCDGKEDRYLNLFIVPDGDNWKVSAVGIAVTNNCLTELTEDEKERLWNFGTAYNYKNMCISMCDASNIDINTMSSYAVPDASCEKIVVDISTVAKRKTVSEIIQKWFSMQTAIQSGEFEKNEDSMKLAECLNIRSQVVEEFAKYCMYAKRCKKYHVSYNGNGTDLKATISLLSSSNQVYEIYLCVDEVHVGMSYMRNENGKWSKSLIPDSIGDAEKLFIQRGR